MTRCVLILTAVREDEHLISLDKAQVPAEPGRKLAILIVDDEKDQRDRMKRICISVVGIDKNFITEASSVGEAIAKCEENDFFVILLDKNIGQENGLKIIPELLSLRPLAKILVVTGSEEIQDVVGAMRLGAEGYIVKKYCQDLISQQIEKALTSARYKRNEQRLRLGDDIFDSEHVETKSPIMKRLLESVKMIAESNRPLLLTGESGTGKTTIARIVHKYRSEILKNTQSRNFVGLNLTSYSSGVIESELFGHEAGAFSGAHKPRVGHIEMAHGGTLFLDEIGETSPEVQTKLLKVIEEKKFYRVGGNREINSDFKLICATNRDLEQRVEEGKFREDFYYRISVFPLRCPSLRERREDIPGLLKQLLPLACKDAKRFVQFEDLPADFVAALIENPPKQNIRGLEIALSQLLTLSRRDRRGTPDLGSWSKIPELRALLGGGKTRGTVPASAITLDEVLKRPFALIAKDFPGLNTVMAAFESKLVLEASEKSDYVKEIPEILKIAPSTAQVKVKRAKEWLAHGASSQQSNDKKDHQAIMTNSNGGNA